MPQQSSPTHRHWAEETYWTEALNRYCAARDSGETQLVIDIAAIEQTLFDGDSPAYRALEAMLSIHEHEGCDGFRGAPRVVLALLQILSEQSRSVQP